MGFFFCFLPREMLHLLTQNWASCSQNEIWTQVYSFWFCYIRIPHCQKTLQVKTWTIFLVSATQFTMARETGGRQAQYIIFPQSLVNGRLNPLWQSWNSDGVSNVPAELSAPLSRWWTYTLWTDVQTYLPILKIQAQYWKYSTRQETFPKLH